ncbi:MAG: hypothetical protein WC516_09785 [Patescibacteria group bacterium]|jgi:hypothetical protein
MRIEQGHYIALDKSINSYLNNNPNIDITTALESVRYRWDIYWHSGGAFTNAQEYQYLTDNHIDTAIKSILRNRLKPC